jgi:hypothetical protein
MPPSYRLELRVDLLDAGVKVVETDEEEIILEVDLKWGGNPSIILGMTTIVGLPLQVQVSGGALKPPNKYSSMCMGVNREHLHILESLTLPA